MLLSKLFPEQKVKMDVGDSRFFEKQLEAIDADLEKESYPEIQYPTLVPTFENFDRGAFATVYRMIKEHGNAALISDKSQNIPMVNLSGTEYSQLVLPVAAGYQFDQLELLGAEKAGVNLDSEDALVAGKSIERTLEEVALLGHDALGIKGLFNHASTHYATAANGAGASPLWTSKTAEEKLKDLQALVSYILTDTADVEKPNTIVLSPTIYSDAALTPMPNSSTSILDWFLKGQPWIKNVYSHHYLTSQAQGTNKRMVAYFKDPTAMKFKVPCGLVTLPAQYEGLNIKINMFKTVAGLEMRKPRAVNYLDGV